MTENIIRLDISGIGSHEAAIVLREWFSSPYVGRRVLPRGRKRVEITVDGESLPAQAPRAALPQNHSAPLVDGYISWRTSMVNPLSKVDYWIRLNPHLRVSVSVSRRRQIHVGPEAAIRSVISQIVLSDLQFLAPGPVFDSGCTEFLDNDHVLAVLTPTEAGRRLRERLVQSTGNLIALDRELFPSLQMLLPEVSGFIPVDGTEEHVPRRRVHTFGRDLRLTMSSRSELILLKIGFSIVRLSSVLPKQLVYLIHRLTGGDLPLESWRLTERRISFSMWGLLNRLKEGAEQ